MSSSAAANAAALAAFNAIGRKNSEAEQQNTSTFTLPKPTRVVSHKKPTRKESHASLQVVIPKPRMGSQDSRSLHTPTDISPLARTPKPSPRILTNSNGDNDRSVDYFSEIHKMGQPRRQSQTPQEVIKNLKQSIESKAIVNTPDLKRLSTDYAPKEMIKNLKDSINQKVKVSQASQATAYEKSPKGQAILNDMRDRIESRMKAVSGSMNSLTLTEKPEPLRIPSTGSTRSMLYEPLLNNSYSSFGSSYLEGQDDTFTRPQNVEDKERQNSTGISIDITHHEGESELSLQEPIEIERRVIVEESKGKVKRKPPSDLMYEELPGDPFYDMERPNKGRSTDVISSASLYIQEEDDVYSVSDAESYMYDNLPERPLFDYNGEGNKFPKFPDISSKRKEHKNKKKQKIKGVDHSVNLIELENESDEDISNIYRQSNTSLVQQPVQFRTTMRKNKKKDKKTSFNENKPWKNHSDLNFPNEQERKRYEGLWASNKGNYMDYVVHRLQGVDYTSTDDVSTEHEEVSKMAAKLSSNHQANLKNDEDNYHNLVKADLNQLIHASVVKRIWKRSRLPQDTLEQIWNLVDFRKDGTLNKNEFLVGMWLVDQCLYGRKLPKKVDQVVWDSLGGIGVNVAIKKKSKRL